MDTSRSYALLDNQSLEEQFEIFAKKHQKDALVAMLMSLRKIASTREGVNTSELDISLLLILCDALLTKVTDSKELECLS